MELFTSNGGARASESMRPRFYLTRTSGLILIILLVTSIGASIASYEYSNRVSSNVADLSVGQVHSSTQIEAADLGNILSKSLSAVADELSVIASSQSISTRNATGALHLLSAAQNSTAGFTYAYFWLDKNGLLLVSYNGTGSIYPPGAESDLKQRPYFTGPNQTLSTFYSSATPSIQNTSIQYVYVSVPILSTGANGAKQFGGVVAAAIDLRTLGSALQRDLSPQFKSAMGLVDFKGIVLFSANESSIGENIFSSNVQATIPSSLRTEFDSFLTQSLSGKAGYQDISFNGNSGTIAYQPVLVNTTSADGTEGTMEWGVLYVSAPDTLAASATTLIDQSRLVSAISILAIAAISGGVAFVILRSNKRLNDVVEERTSALTEANKELELKAKAEKDMLSITAHELRTPTQSILVNSEILRQAIRPTLGLSTSSSGSTTHDALEGAVQPSDLVEMVESTYRNARSLQRLTQNILEVARIENHTVQLQMEDFDLNQQIRDSIEDAKVVHAPRADGGDGVDVIFSFEPKNPVTMVRGDRHKVDEVIANLLSNAAKFSPAGSIVRVSTEETDGFAVVKVADRGPGVDPEILPKLFTKFTTKTGTGLGLFISKAYVEAQGGSIKAENEPDGRGAIFTFTIPKSQEPQEE
jgi:signal transduction histidine kinase/uncharacterized protein YcfL